MMPDVWNMTEPLTAENRQSNHQRSDQSNNNRKRKDKQPCSGECGSPGGTAGSKFHTKKYNFIKNQGCSSIQTVHSNSGSTVTLIKN